MGFFFYGHLHTVHFNIFINGLIFYATSLFPYCCFGYLGGCLSNHDWSTQRKILQYVRAIFFLNHCITDSFNYFDRSEICFKVHVFSCVFSDVWHRMRIFYPLIMHTCTIHEISYNFFFFCHNTITSQRIWPIWRLQQSQ